LNRFIRSGNWEASEDHGLEDCIECGCCDFACPSHIPLVEWFRFGKSQLRSRAEDRRRADLARDRFEARGTRLERIKAERKRRIAEKKRALGDQRTMKDRIAASVERARQRKESAE
jgi:electron transport complex protein RnfC